VSFLSNEEEMLVELRKIRESLEKAPPPPPPVPPKAYGWNLKIS